MIYIIYTYVYFSLHISWRMKRLPVIPLLGLNASVLIGSAACGPA